jgi:hypothetical protein
MKKLLLLILAFMSIANMQITAQPGQNCFNTQFHNNATGLDMNNAYLLNYLCTMSYPDYLRFLMSNPPPARGSSVVLGLQRHDDDFLNEYRENLAPFFTAPATTSIKSGSITPVNSQIKSPANSNLSIASVTNAEPTVIFQFHHKCNPIGYDPEALLISTPSTIYVVFRGTDRVACNTTSLGYEWAEWMASDFKFLKRDASMMHPGIKGQVHRGMVESVTSQNFAQELATAIDALQINKLTKVPKKVWITGHSLGGAHAQLFAMYLKYNFNITVQGLYIYESPHPGDQNFVNQLNTDIGKTHIQRFEFGDDPICTLPPQSFFFARAGERNYFKDYTSTNLRSEQTLADDAKILCALGNLPGEQIPAAANFVFPPLCPGSACFHHPTFILEALRHQLNTSLLSSLPAKVPLPVAGDNCNLGDLNKAENNDLINNTVTAVETTIANIVWGAGNIVDNLIGSGLQEGNYKIACYGFKNNSKKYLHWNGSNNSQLTISTSATVFKINHKDLSLCQGAGGYQLFVSNNNMAADVKYIAGVSTGFENTNNIIMKAKDDCIGDEETWYFFKVPNHTNTYVLYNWNTHKVLDAPNNCLTTGSCSVNEFSASSNNPTQVWILEKQ